jgi:hypothetical protein
LGYKYAVVAHFKELLLGINALILLLYFCVNWYCHTYPHPILILLLNRPLVKDTGGGEERSGELSGDTHNGRTNPTLILRISIREIQIYAD